MSLPHNDSQPDTDPMPQWWQHWLAPIIEAPDTDRATLTIHDDQSPDGPAHERNMTRRAVPGRRPAALGATRRRIVLTVGVAAVAAAAAVGLWGPTPRHPASVTQTSTPTPPSVAETDPVLGGSTDCAATRTPAFTRGNGVGATDSGPDVILAFQHAYYVGRDGTQARAVVAPDANVPGADVIQAGISTVPAATTHCVAITGQAQNRYAITVTETHPDTTTRSFAEVITTTQVNGRTVIASIAGA